MKRLIVLIILIGVTLSAWGQPPSVEIITPVSGKILFIDELQQNDGNTENQLFSLDTQSGAFQIIGDLNEWSFGNPFWSNDGEEILYDASNSLLGPLHFTIFDSVTQSYIRIWEEERAFVLDWNGEEVLYTVYISVPPSLETILYSLDISEQTNYPIATFLQGDSIVMPMQSLPVDIANSLKLDSLIEVSWNPVYEDWVLMKIRAHSDGSASSVDEGTTFILHSLYNLQTQEVLSINEVVGYDTAISAEWDHNGDFLYIVMSQAGPTYTNILKFDPVQESLLLLDPFTVDKNLQGWLGISDLFLSVTIPVNEMQDVIFYIGQPIDGEMRYIEFLRLPRSVFVASGGVGHIDWIYLGDESETQRLSCIFDETLPTRLEIGIQAQVAFTDGTPSRLRSEPSTWGDVVQSLPEGTAFEVIGGYMCGSGYRWWQVQLADGTQGWIAEASETEYWIEPLSDNHLPTTESDAD